MSEESSALKRFILNSSLILLGVLVLILFYALAANHFSEPRQEENSVLAPVEQGTTAVREIYDVEILNGCGEHGLAAKLREYLIAHHFDVVGTGNHDNFNVSKTQVIDRKGNDVAARRIASILGVDPRNIVRDLNQNRQVDVSIIIGKDYKSIDPFTD